MVLQGVSYLVALGMGVHRVVLLPAVLRLVLQLGIQVVHHPGLLLCRTGWRIWPNTMSSSVSISPHRGPDLAGGRPRMLSLLR